MKKGADVARLVATADRFQEMLQTGFTTRFDLIEPNDLAAIVIFQQHGSALMVTIFLEGQETLPKMCMVQGFMGWSEVTDFVERELRVPHDAYNHVDWVKLPSFLDDLRNENERFSTTG